MEYAEIYPQCIGCPRLARRQLIRNQLVNRILEDTEQQALTQTANMIEREETGNSNVPNQALESARASLISAELLRLRVLDRLAHYTVEQCEGYDKGCHSSLPDIYMA